MEINYLIKRNELDLPSKPSQSQSQRNHQYQRKKPD